MSYEKRGHYIGVLKAQPKKEKKTPRPIVKKKGQWLEKVKT